MRSRSEVYRGRGRVKKLKNGQSIAGPSNMTTQIKMVISSMMRYCMSEDEPNIPFWRLWNTSKRLNTTKQKISASLVPGVQHCLVSAYERDQAVC